MKKKRILVTGGAGFVGSHLCAQLLADGAHVFCLDNFYTGREANLQALIRDPAFEIIQHDVCEPFATTLQVDAIYHLACPASPIHYQRDPIQTTKTSVLGTLNVLALAKQYHIPVVFTSTSEVYGDPIEHPQQETYWGTVNPIGPRACYDEGKRCAESLCVDYYRQHRVDVRIARLFNTYGPHMSPNDGRVISNFIVQALNNAPLTLYGDGQQTRSFCYVDDTVAGLRQLMAHTEDPFPFNLGNPVEKTVSAIADLIIQLTNSQSACVFHPLPTDDPKQRCPDITRAQHILQWEPRTTLEAGLVKTIDYFRAVGNLQ